MPAEQRRSIAEWLAIGGWATAPFSGLVLANVLWLSHLLLAASVALLIARKPGLGANVPNQFRRLLAGTALIGTGILIGTLRSGDDAELTRVAGYAITSLLPTVALLRLRPGTRLTALLASVALAGTCLSILVGLAGNRAAAGHLYGLAGHKNRLAMTIVIALPLLGFLVRGRRHAPPVAPRRRRPSAVRTERDGRPFGLAWRTGGRGCAGRAVGRSHT